MKKLPDKDNSLIRDFRRTKFKEEDFTTEAFASLLIYLVNNDRRFAIRFLNLLTSRKFNLRKYDSTEVKIRTQVRTHLGTPDIEISALDFLIYIEVKVESKLNDNQIERYNSLLRHSGKSSTLLVVITKYRVWFDEKPDYHIRWLQIANWLKKESINIKLNETRKLITQFLDFLQYRYIICTPVRKRISPSLKKYIQRKGKKSVFTRWMMRSNAIGDDPDLTPLRNLIDTMALTIEKVYPNKKFGFDNTINTLDGKFDGLGFGIDYKYNFFVDIKRPDVLIFCRSLNHRINPAEFRGDFGKLVEFFGNTYWINTLDLRVKDISFFTKSLDEQITILSLFLKKSQTASKGLLVKVRFPY